MRRRCLVLGVLVAACGHPNGPSKNEVSPRPAPPTPARAADAALLSELSVLATAGLQRPERMKKWSEGITHGQRTLEQYVDYLLAQPEFGRVVAPEILFGETLFRPTTNLNRMEYYQLKITPAKDGKPIAFLTKPCAEKEAVEVEPWWALGTKIKVCPAAHKPDVWVSRKAGTTCNSVEGAPTFDPTSPCGCGPNLIRCYLDDGLEMKRKMEAHDEIRDTVAYVVDHDLPVQAIYSGTFTFRRRNLEGIYRWQQIESERRTDAAALLRDLPSWPEGGKWAERVEIVPGQHAGLITALANIYQQPDPRQRQWRLFDILWCTGVSSTGVSTDAILSLNVHSLQQRNEGWKELAARPVCTNCHARMDYGFQFFNAYPSPVSGAGHYVPTLQERTKLGPLFLRDHDDQRGEAALTPTGFTNLAMSQPEFPACVSNRFTEHTFGVRNSGEDAAAVQKVFASKTVTLKQIAKAAMMRYALRSRTGVAALPPGAIEKGPLSAHLQEALKEACGDCHTSGATIPDLETANVSRSLLVKSLDLISSKYMPRGQTMPLQERLAIVRMLVDQLWSDPKQRTQAFEWFSSELQQPETNRLSAMDRSIDQLVGIPIGPKWNAIEHGIHADQMALTANVGLLTTLEALRACKSTHVKGKALEACVERATPTSLLSR